MKKDLKKTTNLDHDIANYSNSYHKKTITKSSTWILLRASSDGKLKICITKVHVKMMVGG